MLVFFWSVCFCSVSALSLSLAPCCFPWQHRRPIEAAEFYCHYFLTILVLAQLHSLKVPRLCLYSLLLCFALVSCWYLLFIFFSFSACAMFRRFAQEALHFALLFWCFLATVAGDMTKKKESEREPSGNFMCTGSTNGMCGFCGQ